MKKIKMTFAAFLFSLGFSAVAFAVAPQLPANVDASGLLSPIPVQTPAMTGLLTYTLDSNTATLQGIMVPGTSGATGTLYALYVTSGAVNDEAIAIDSAPAAGTGMLGVATGANFGSLNVVHLSPSIISPGQAPATACTSVSVCGNYAPPFPVRFANGILLDRKGTANVTVLYRLDAITSTAAHP